MSSTDQSAAPSLAEFFQTGRQLGFKKGEIIIRNDDTPSGVFLIKSGYVKVYSINKLGNERIRVILVPGEVFSVIWALTGTAPNVFFEAMGPVTVSRVSKDSFVKFVSTSPEASVAITRNIIDLFIVYAARIDNLEMQYAQDKIMYLLLTLANRVGVNKGESSFLPAEINQQVIADSLSLARETASREMSKLERKKTIHYEKRQIVINDLAALRKYFA